MFHTDLQHASTSPVSPVLNVQNSTCRQWRLFWPSSFWAMRFQECLTGEASKTPNWPSHAGPNNSWEAKGAFWSMASSWKAAKSTWSPQLQRSLKRILQFSEQSKSSKSLWRLLDVDLEGLSQLNSACGVAFCYFLMSFRSIPSDFWKWIKLHCNEINLRCYSGAASIGLPNGAALMQSGPSI